MDMGFSSRKNPKMPGAHKIGAAISGPRIAGGNFMDITLFLRNAEGDGQRVYQLYNESLERRCASQEGGSMLLRREGGFLRRGEGS